MVIEAIEEPIVGTNLKSFQSLAMNLPNLL